MSAHLLHTGDAPTLIRVLKDGTEASAPVLPLAYATYQPEYAAFDAFRAAGYPLVSVCAYLSDHPINEYTDAHPFDGCLWPEEDRFDFSPLEATLARAVGDAAPGETYILLRVNLNMPSWWREKHPDQLTRMPDGRVFMQSVFSDVWKRDASRALDALIAWLRDSDFAPYMLGLQLGAMNTEEWIAPIGTSGCLDVSAPALSYFRSYLAAVYPSVQAWHTAWAGTADGYASFEDAPFPPESLRAAVMARPFLSEDSGDGLPSRPVVDQLRAFNQGYADAITSLCTHAKEAVGGAWLIGCFYGYIGQLPAHMGHSAVMSVMDCPAIDFLASPFTYVDMRRSAEDWYFHGAMNSFTLRGKLWFVEADVRTHLSRFLKDNRPWLLDGSGTKNYEVPVWLGPDSVERSLSDLTRSFAKILTARHAMWWFDMWGGWYDHPAYADFMKKAAALYAKHYPTPIPQESKPRVAVLLDEQAGYGVGSLFGELVSRQMILLGHIGCPYDLCLLDDLPQIPRDAYDLWICPAAALDLRAAGDPVIGALTALAGSGAHVFLSGRQTRVTEGTHLSLSRASAFGAETVAEALDEAGIHRWTRDGSLVFTDGRLLCVTAVSDGEHRIILPRDARLRNVLTGETLNSQNACVTVTLEVGESVLWELLPPTNDEKNGRTETSWYLMSQRF